jgi:hypothetical protein
VNNDGCLNGEHTALAQLKKTWATFDADSRGECVSLVTRSSIQSYVTLQDCLQMSRDAKNQLKQDSKSGTRGSP